MREQLNMRYKKVSLRSISASTKDNREHLKEAAIILNSLLESNVTIFFIDEYNISEQDASCYNWSQKGKDDYLYVQPRKPSIHIIAAVCKDNLIQIHTQKETIKSDDFRDFLSELILKIKNELSYNQNQPFVLFFDNAKIHKTQKIQDELQQQMCLGILNCPYAPELNFCEKFIKLHKQRIKQELSQQKIPSIGLIKKTAKDISLTKFQQEFKLYHPLIKNIIFQN